MKRARRIEWIDIARGILLFWMILGHANRAGRLPEDHWLFRLRLGAATEGFVMLSGLSVALLYDPKRNPTRKSQRLLRRAVQLAVIAYASNVVLSLLRDGLQRQLSLDHVVDVLLGSAPWTISAVLLGTSLTLFAMPPLLALSRKVPSCVTLLITAAIGLAAVSAALWQERTPDWIDLLFVHGGIFGFPIGLLCCLGIWAFGLGIFLNRHNGNVWMLLTAPSLVLYCRQWVGFVPFHPFSFTTAKFVLLLALAKLLSRSPVFGVREFAALLGRSSLLVFLVHRIVMQAQLLLIGDRLSAVGLAIACIVGTTAICGVLCYVRERYESLSAALKAVGM